MSTITNRYKTITGIYGYHYGIYEGGQAVIQTNGRRYRTLVDCVRWKGNSGGHHTQVTYLDKASGRKLLRRVREAKICELKGEIAGITVLEIIMGVSSWMP